MEIMGFLSYILLLWKQLSEMGKLKIIYTRIKFLRAQAGLEFFATTCFFRRVHPKQVFYLWTSGLKVILAQTGVAQQIVCHVSQQSKRSPV